MILLRESPCVGICKLDANRQYCIGCNRTLKEIYEAGKKSS